MKLYKLTEQDGTTYKGTMTWEVGKSNAISKIDRKPELCTGGVIHAYKNKNLALLLNPIHAAIENFRLFECEGDVVVEDWGKVGVYSLIVKKELKIPQWYNEHSLDATIMFLIFCAEKVKKYYNDLYPQDESVNTAIKDAKNALESRGKFKDTSVAVYAVDDAVDAAAYTRADVAYSAAACAAANAAACARAADAAAHTAVCAASYAVYAADAACAANNKIDFCKLADEAVRLIQSNNADKQRLKNGKRKITKDFKTT